MNHYKHLGLSAAAALLLTACGGGGGGGNSNAGGNADPLVGGTDVPTSATASASGALEFVKRVVAMDGAGAEPLVLGDVTLGTSETDDTDPGI